jgi:2-keto-4-pentenoate hydratase
MDARLAQRASLTLVRHWRAGTVLASLPEDLRPANRAEGYAIQAQLEHLSDRPLWGWKIAATSVAGQSHIGVDGPLAGRLLAEMAHADGATLDLDANRMRVAEPEFAFRIGRALVPRAQPYTPAEVMAAVDTLHPAIEIPDSRFADFATAGAAQLIADNACAHMFVLGPQAPAAWRDLDLAAHPVVGHVGARLVREGRGDTVLGDPRVALAWLANEVSRHGVALAAGQVVTTGTCMAPLEILPGDKVTADFGALGTVGVRFRP